jgi:hypothetical protein
VTCARSASAPAGAEPDNFRSAARLVLKRQFLLLERPGDRDAYRLIVNHFDYFVSLFDALGWTLHRDDTFGLVGLLPGDAEGFRHLRLVDSLMLLCLRLLYEEGLERFEAREGSVYTPSRPCSAATRPCSGASCRPSRTTGRSCAGCAAGP